MFKKNMILTYSLYGLMKFLNWQTMLAVEKIRSTPPRMVISFVVGTAEARRQHTVLVLYCTWYQAASQSSTWW